MDLESSIEGVSLNSNNVGLHPNIIKLDAHLEIIQDELLPWDSDSPPTLRIASFDKNVLGTCSQRMSSVVSVSSTSG